MTTDEEDYCNWRAQVYAKADAEMKRRETREERMKRKAKKAKDRLEWKWTNLDTPDYLERVISTLRIMAADGKIGYEFLREMEHNLKYEH